MNASLKSSSMHLPEALCVLKVFILQKKKRERRAPKFTHARTQMDGEPHDKVIFVVLKKPCPWCFPDGVPSLAQSIALIIKNAHARAHIHTKAHT